MEHGRPIFRKIISRNRFQDILHVLRVDDAAARRSRRLPDKFSPMRNVFEIWNESLLNAFVSCPNLTVDEQPVTFHGRCPFRQYMPSKLIKYGFKIWAICDLTSLYVLKMDVYKGREIGELREINLGSKLVLKLSEPFKKVGEILLVITSSQIWSWEENFLCKISPLWEQFERTGERSLLKLCPPKTEKNLLLSMAIKKKR